MNPFILAGFGVAGIILGKVFSKVNKKVGDNDNNNNNNNSDNINNDNVIVKNKKTLTRKEILKAVNARVDKLERIKKKKEAKGVEENADVSGVDSSNISDSVCTDGSGIPSTIKKENEENEEKTEIVLDNNKENV